MNPELERWAERQRSALITAGVHPLDAEVAIRWVLENLPAGADPDEWIPDAGLLPFLLASDPVTQQDAAAAWMANGAIPPTYNRILYATPAFSDEADDQEEDRTTALLLAYFFFLDEARYAARPRLTRVTQKKMRHLLDLVVDEEERALGALNGSFQRAEVAPGPWLFQSRTQLRRLHNQLHSLGSGGFRNMSERDFLAIDTTLVREFAHLRRMAGQVRAGEVSLPQALDRAVRYVGAARTEFWDAWEEAQSVGPGMTLLAMRHLRPAEHCEDCIEYFDQGWQRRGVLPAPGIQSRCGNSCRCYKTYTTVPFDEAETWIGTRRNQE